MEGRGRFSPVLKEWVKTCLVVGEGTERSLRPLTKFLSGTLARDRLHPEKLVYESLCYLGRRSSVKMLSLFCYKYPGKRC